MTTWERKIELAVLKSSVIPWLRQWVSRPAARPRTGPGTVLLTEEWWMCRGRRGLRRRRRSHV